MHQVFDLCGLVSELYKMPLILKVDKDATQSEAAIGQAARLIRKGTVVAFPTETFYALLQTTKLLQGFICLKNERFTNP